MKRYVENRSAERREIALSTLIVIIVEAKLAPRSRKLRNAFRSSSFILKEEKEEESGKRASISRCIRSVSVLHSFTLN